LNWDPESLRCEDTKNSVSPGNLVMIELASPTVTQIFTAFGRLGVSAEVGCCLLIVETSSDSTRPAGVRQDSRPLVSLPNPIAILSQDTP
jgi:RNA 3'-terminal phosphate cyclase (ATP)